MRYCLHIGFILTLGFWLLGCTPEREQPTGPSVGERLERQGDEIMVAGQLVHTGAPVVLWTDPGGYDAYRTERRFAPWEEASYQATTRSSRYIDSPNRYGIRFDDELSEQELEQVRGGGWTLDMLRDKVDQFVLHYDVCGLSARCFDVLHDRRGLSVHFMLDLDGTIYQTMDLKERAWHATKANDRSVGIEIANMGAYPPPEEGEMLLPDWYERLSNGEVIITIPESLQERYGENGGMRVKDYTPRPAEDQPVLGEVQGRKLAQWDLTPQQYDSLVKLTAALSEALPKIRLVYPTDSQGQVVSHTLEDERWEQFQGVLGHWHIQDNKIDPGPALDWQKVINDARRLRDRPSVADADRAVGHGV